MIEVTYRGRDNSISLRLKSSTVNDPILRITDLTNVQRMILARKDGFTVDSAKEANIFDWSTLATDGIVTIQLGHLNIKTGRDHWRLIVYDPTNSLGIVWGDRDFRINIKEKYASS